MRIDSANYEVATQILQLEKNDEIEMTLEKFFEHIEVKIDGDIQGGDTFDFNREESTESGIF